MSRTKPVNLEASVRSRLRNLSLERGEPFMQVLTRYGLERLLYRLSQSRWHDRFILKGAALFAAWSDRPHRTTRDVDLLGIGHPDIRELETIFGALCSASVEPDGIRFLAGTMQGSAIRREAEYQGVRIKLEARIERIVIRLQVDIGYGDKVFPAPRVMTYPVLLNFPAPRLRSYSRYAVVAEKFQIMIERGLPNSRMKDYYDLFKLAQRFRFAGATLTRALRSTLERRKTPLPVATPDALSVVFARDPVKRIQWRSFVTKNGLEPEAVELEDVITALREFLMPVLNAIVRGTELSQVWKPGVGWQARSKTETTASR